MWLQAFALVPAQSLTSNLRITLVLTWMNQMLNKTGVVVPGCNRILVIQHRTLLLHQLQRSDSESCTNCITTVSK